MTTRRTFLKAASRCWAAPALRAAPKVPPPGGIKAFCIDFNWHQERWPSPMDQRLREAGTLGRCGSSAARRLVFGSWRERHPDFRRLLQRLRLVQRRRRSAATRDEARLPSRIGPSRPQEEHARDRATSAPAPTQSSRRTTPTLATGRPALFTSPLPTTTLPIYPAPSPMRCGGPEWTGS